MFWSSADDFLQLRQADSESSRKNRSFFEALCKDLLFVGQEWIGLRMKFAPRFMVNDVTPPKNQCPRQFDDSLKAAILALVERRNDAIRCGDRTGLDATSCGMSWRWNDSRDDDHEQTSCYDWYMNRIERGMGAEIKAVTGSPVYNFSLPANQI